MNGVIIMLKIDRIKIAINTINGQYGFDEVFHLGLNFIASEKNTSGKSSILSSIYYCLGFEEIIGGRGEKVLTSVFKYNLEDEGNILLVTESHIYLQINNGDRVLTVYRTTKKENRDDKLITIYHCNIDDIESDSIKKEDYYVHMPNSAISKNGFHTFLEDFLQINLPIVPTTDDSERKLYLQLLFSAIFIEQKRGWSDILSGMPYLGIKDSKKRVIEFLLGLDVFDNEKKRLQCQIEKNTIENEWRDIYKLLKMECSKEEFVLEGLTTYPRTLENKDLNNIVITTKANDRIVLNEMILELEKDLSLMLVKKKKVIENYDVLQHELEQTEDSLRQIENQIKQEKTKRLTETDVINRLIKTIEVIETDIINNKDALKLKHLGSNLGCLTADEICPVCNQQINDSLLIRDQFNQVMSIENNINHLEQQKNMLIFSLQSHEKYKTDIDDYINILQSKYFSLMKLAKSIRNDLFSVNDDISETLIQKRLLLKDRIYRFQKLDSFLEMSKSNIWLLSKRWNEYLTKKDQILKSRFSERDEYKINFMKDQFIIRLKKYGFKSTLDVDKIRFSMENYLPLIDNFDMKFDSSASDNIRAIWAYTTSLLYTSIMQKGNHPNILIFDEPNQQSIITIDMKHFFEDIITLDSSSQIFIGITLVDDDQKDILKKLPGNRCKIIDIGNKAFTKIDL